MSKTNSFLCTTLAIFILSTVASSFKLSNNFKQRVDSQEYANMNFIVKYLLTYEEPNQYTLQVEKQLTSIGLVAIHHNSIKDLLVAVAKHRSEHHSAESIHQDDEDFSLQQSIFVTMLADTDNIINNMNNLGFEGQQKKLETFKMNIKALLKQYLVNEIKAHMDNKNLINTPFKIDDKLLSDKLDQAIEDYSNGNHEKNLVDTESLRKSIKEMMDKIVRTKIPIVLDYFAYKNNSLEILSEFTHTLMKYLKNNDIEWTSTSANILKEVFKAIYEININKSEVYNQILNFGKDYVFDEIMQTDNIILRPLNIMLFDLFYEFEFNNEMCTIGKKMFLLYIFSNNVPNILSNKRQATLKMGYNKKSLASKDKKVFYETFNADDKLFKADFIWTTSGECAITEDDFKNLMISVEEYHKYDVSQLKYINMSERYFTTNARALDSYFEVYNSFYNLIINETIRLKKIDLNIDSFIKRTHDFVNISFLLNLSSHNYNTNIKEHYLLFKLICLKYDHFYYTKNDNKFLSFNLPTRFVSEDFMDLLDGLNSDFETLHNLREYFTLWKLSLNPMETSKKFTIKMLSDFEVSKDVTNNYLYGDKRDLSL